MNEFLNLTVALSKNYWWLRRYTHSLSHSHTHRIKTVNIQQNQKTKDETRTARVKSQTIRHTQHTINTLCLARANECMIQTNLARNTQMKTVKLRETFPFICWAMVFFGFSFLCTTMSLACECPHSSSLALVVLPLCRYTMIVVEFAAFCCLAHSNCRQMHFVSFGLLSPVLYFAQNKHVYGIESVAQSSLASPSIACANMRIITAMLCIGTERAECGHDLS